MHYTTITAWELRKMDWVKVKLERQSWEKSEWYIKVDEKEVSMVYNWVVYYFAPGWREGSFKADINRLETIEDFTEWELVYVSDNSVEHALQAKNKEVYIYTNSKWIHITQLKWSYNHNWIWDFCWYWYIAKIPQEESVEMTMEEINKAIWKKVNIIE